MSQNNPYQPPQSGQYIPPPPPPGYQGGSDIPPSSPYHYSGAPSSARKTGGIAGGLVAVLAAVWAYGKYALFLVFMGHVVEIRRQGMHATAPVFIPFLGAAIFQRSHPTDALKQALIGIAGPIGGTIGATAAFLLYGATQNPILLLAAWIGFYINLFNLIPFWMLDGGWIMAPTTRAFRFGASAVVAAAGLFLGFAFSPLLIVIGAVGVVTAATGRRNESNPYYASVPMRSRAAIGVAWLVLVLYLGLASAQAFALLHPLAR